MCSTCAVGDKIAVAIIILSTDLLQDLVPRAISSISFVLWL